jgi:hypothetical protein
MESRTKRTKNITTEENVIIVILLVKWMKTNINYCSEEEENKLRRQVQ